MNGKKIIRNIKTKKNNVYMNKRMFNWKFKKHTLSKDHKERNITKS